MTAAGEVLAAEIEREGPIPFRRFMEVALYHPRHGYYRRPHDAFGREGDFFTAEQMQPVFGILKSVLGFRQFLLRGLDKVRGEWSLVTMAWNMKRIFALDTR